MARRRQRNPIDGTPGQDPGKDLFAFLFLMVMVFSLLAMAGSTNPDKAPRKEAQKIRQDTPGRSRLTVIAGKKLGRLAKKQGQVFICFDSQCYSPVRDISRLEKDGRLHEVKEKGGILRKTIFLEKNTAAPILLNEYLDAFKALADSGIDAAFSQKRE